MQFVNGSYQSGAASDSTFKCGPNDSRSLLMKSGAITATGSNTINVDGEVNGFNAVLVTVLVSAVSGTTPTLTVSVQDALTTGGSYSTEGSSGVISATGTYQFVAFLTKRFYRVSWTVGGTTPSFSVSIHAKPLLIISA